MTDTDKGIVILGAPRSGTTLVRRILNAHSAIACPGETCLLSACSRFLETETVADGLDFGAVSGLAFAGFEPDDVVDRLREFATGFHREFAARHGKRRWAEKTAVDIYHLDRIAELLGDRVQYLFVVRHGLDVACSMQEFSDRGYTYLRELHEYVQRHPRPLEAFAHAWSDACRDMQRFVEAHPDDCHVVHYEKLIEDPEAVVPEIFGFLGEDNEADILEKAMRRPESTGFGDWKTWSRQRIESGSVERWRKLPPTVVNRLGAICNETLQSLGYEPVGEGPAPSQKAARRKYEFSLTFGANTGKDGK